MPILTQVQFLTQFRNIIMIDATHLLESAQRNNYSGINWIKLKNDNTDWIVCRHPSTPIGYVAISGVNNGSFRKIELEAFLAVDEKHSRGRKARAAREIRKLTTI